MSRVVALLVVLALACVVVSNAMPIAKMASGARGAAEVAGADPDTFLDTMALIRQRGFKAEAHEAITSDGYKLTLHRIPAPGKPVVLLQHGLLDTSATFVINGAKESLGYILSSQGFDVWIANSRGNKYSQGHTKLSTSDSAYWSFTFDQHATLDIPASVSKALAVSGRSQLVLISHSQGATASFIGLSEIPSLKRQVSLFIALAPVTFLEKQGSVVLGALGTARADGLLKLVGDRQIIPVPTELSKLLGKTCALVPSACALTASTLFGKSTSIPRERDGVFAAHWPDRTSVRNMRHWIQNTRSGKFSDFTGTKNYGQQISKISTPIAIFSGAKDLLADISDINTLKNAVRSVLVQSKSLPEYSHMDFTWAPDAASKVYGDVIQLAFQYSSK